MTTTGVFGTELITSLKVSVLSFILISLIIFPFVKSITNTLDPIFGTKFPNPPGSERLWLFGGTGDLYNLTDVQVDLNKVNNIYFGIKDIDFPTFKSKTNTTTPTPLLNCTDTDGQRCYADGKMGWYIDLSDQKKVVNEPTFTGNYTYYPIFKPNKFK